jgi:hypothetical protein
MDIKVVRIVKKSKVLLGAGLGLLIAGGLETLIGAAESAKKEGWEKVAGSDIALLGIVGGLLIVGVGGAFAAKDETISFEKRYPKAIEVYLEKLRKKARIRDYK